MFLLFDKSENYIAILKNVISAKNTEEINGENTLEITTLDKVVDKGYKVAYKSDLGLWCEFIVAGVETEHTSEGIEKRLFCESSFYETIGDYVDDKRPQNVTANIALANALLTTRWEVGFVDDLGINSTSFYRISVKEAVQKVAQTWQGELRTRVIVSGNKIINRYVDLFVKRGNDLGKRFTYTKDLEGVTKIIHRDDVVTALYGYGKGEQLDTGGYGRRIDFADINDGKAYVENLDALAIWGRPNGLTKSHVFSKIEFDDCEDKEELLTLTTAKLAEVSEPLITYEAKVIDLGGADLGDMVAVIDKGFTPELRLKARVVKIIRDLLEPENNDLILGNFIPNIADALNKQQSHINNFRDKQGVWDRSNQFNQDGTLDTQWLQGEMDVVKNKLISTNSGWYTDSNGNIVFDAKDGSSSMMLSGAGFMIANSKLGNGEWDYRTFGTGDGFVADMIIAGILKGGKVNFDLTNGTLLMGDDINNYSFLFDGTNLWLNGQVNFTDIGQIVTWINGQKLYITDAEIVSSLRIGDYAYIPRSNGNLSFKWVGDTSA